MPRQISLVLSLLVLVTGAVFGSTSEQTQAQATEQVQAQDSNYKVIKGDTLWMLTEKYYGDPWVWTKVWQVNKSSINDPNMIYPDQVLIMPDKSRLKDIVLDVVVPMPMPEPAETAAANEAAVTESVKAPKAEETVMERVSVTEEAAAVELETAETEAAPVMEVAALPGFNADKQEVSQEAEAAVKPVAEPVSPKESASDRKSIAAESMVVPKKWAADGEIVGEKEKKLMIAAGDTVYVNIGSEKVKNGTQCMIYRKMGKISNLGYEMRRVGKLEISESSGNKVSSAKVIVSYEPIYMGDSVKIIQME